jgi:hypothetical protein
MYNPINMQVGDE